jgi:hypothetical protein
MKTLFSRLLVLALVVLGTTEAFAEPKAFKAFRVNSALAVLTDKVAATKFVRKTEKYLAAKYNVKINSSYKVRLFGWKFRVHAKGENADAAIAEYEAEMRSSR